MADCDPEPEFNLSIQKVCYCILNDGTYRFWFEITNKNDIPVDYNWTVSTNPITGSGTIGKGIGPSQTRLDYIYVDVPADDLPGILRLYRSCDGDFQQSIGFNPPNFRECDRCPYPEMLDPHLTLIADPTGCLYATPESEDDHFTLTAYTSDYSLGPLVGATVTFTIDTGTNIASFSGTDADVHTIDVTTDANGVATAYVYQDGTYLSGDVTVSATVTDTTFADLTDTDSVTVSFCPKCEFVSLSADDYILNASTPSTTLRAYPLDYAGNPMPDGYIVNFATTVGTISNVTSVSGGEATALLTYDDSTLPIVAVVSTATPCGSNDHIEVTFLPLPEQDLFLVAVPPKASLCEGNTTLYAEFQTNVGGVEGREVTFSIVTDPAPDTSSASLSSSTATTNAQGIASVTLYNDEEETVVVEASVEGEGGTITSNQLSVEFTPLTVKLASLVSPATTDSLPTLNTCSQDTLPVTVEVTDCNDDPMPNVTVYFSTTSGSFNTSSVATNAEGQATAYLSPSGDAEIADVTASCPCGTSFYFDVVFTPGDACSIDAYAVPSVIPADGMSISLVYADVYDCCGNPVSDGTNVCFMTDAGTMLYEPPQDATVTGTAHMPLQSSRDPTLATVLAYLCEDDTISDVATVTFEPLISESQTGADWSPFFTRPLLTYTLSRAQTIWDCLQGSLPEQPSSDLISNLEEIQAHIAQAATLTNPIHASGELASAIDLMCEIARDLGSDCCER